MVNRDTAIKIRFFRKAQGFSSQYHLAAAAGCSPNTIWLLEKFGYRPEQRIMDGISKALGIPETEIWPTLEEPTNGHHPDEKEPEP